ncbi:endosialin [Gastrophryne carolinensis]
MFLFIFLLRFLISSSYELKEHDAICGPGDSCYAVFYQRRAFLESWRACREKGGNLATIKNGQEAALIEQLLTSSVGSRGNGEPQLRLWIGLQRQPRQCASQKPLRGFTWTTGDQDTAYTNWVNQPVSAGPPSSCSASRCVAIGLGYGNPEDDFKWLDGSCTLPVDGFVCKFRYQGLCPALNEESVHYSVPFGYEGTWLDLVPFGTVAVVSCEGQHQSTSVLCMLKEDGTVGWNNNEPVCRHPEDLQCQECQQLCENGVCTCHEGYVLQPDGRSCEPEEDHSFEVQGCPCQYQCITETGGRGYQCICPEGYDLASDQHSCEDVDECEDEDICEHSCQNTLGSYTCSCDLGFAVSDEDPERCVDVDECRIARMCQQMCVNYDGGFECYCNEGYELDMDRVSCNPIDRYEPNPPVKEHLEPELDSTTEGWYWTAMDDTETTTTGTRTEEPMPPMTSEDTIVDIIDTATTEIAPTSIQDRKKPLQMVTSPTVAPAPTTTLVLKLDKVGKSTYSPIPKIVSSKSFNVLATSLSTKMPEGTSIGPTWLKEATNDLTILQPTTITDSLDKAKESTTDHSDAHLSVIHHSTTEVPATVHKVKATPAKPDIPLPSNDRNAASDDSSTVSPNISQESRGKRDNRWLIVALLVPLCVFIVIMLALGIVYCTRCGGETKPRSVTDCYHWVTGGGPEKSLPPSAVENGRGSV